MRLLLPRGRAARRRRHRGDCARATARRRRSSHWRVIRASSLPARRVRGSAARLEAGALAADALLLELRAIAAEAALIVEAMDFGFLFDEERKLFSIGYRERDGELDASRYDLLASEARLASLVAIAKGDVPAEHWFRLGRRHGDAVAATVLLSWSGSMFEYLMPSLSWKSRRAACSTRRSHASCASRSPTARGTACHGASPSRRSTLRDRELTYQYSTFGVPASGLSAGSPRTASSRPTRRRSRRWYAPLAARRELRSALERLRRARAATASTRRSTSRPRAWCRGQKHRGGARLHGPSPGHDARALANLLLDSRLRRWLHAEPMIQAVELLLQERPGASSRSPVAPTIRSPAPVQSLAPPIPRANSATFPTAATRCMLSNGRSRP